MKTYRTFDRNGRAIRVTVPDEDMTNAATEKQARRMMRNPIFARPVITSSYRFAVKYLAETDLSPADYEANRRMVAALFSCTEETVQASVTKALGLAVLPR